MVVGTLRLHYFFATFRKMKLGPESLIALIRTDHAARKGAVQIPGVIRHGVPTPIGTPSC